MSPTSGPSQESNIAVLMGNVTDLQADVHSLRQDTQDGFNAIRADVRTAMTDMRVEFKERVADHETRLNKMDEALAGLGIAFASHVASNHAALTTITIALTAVGTISVVVGAVVAVAKVFH